MLASLKARWLKVVPPQVIAARGRPGPRADSWDWSGDHLIHIPDKPFEHGIVLPNFAGLFADRSLWWALATTVLTLTLIDGVESLATIAAIDKIDPFRRKSDPNRTLFAMGVSNMCSSMAGGLTIIPGGVKSTACIVSGGRTQWANFYNAAFLILYLLLGRNLINLMPLSALGAIVLYTGYKLCAPRVWKHIAHIGSEQLFVFTATVLVTVSTDLLWGIAAGIVAKLMLEAAIQAKVVRGRSDGHEPLRPGRPAVARADRRAVPQPGRAARGRSATPTTCTSAVRWSASTPFTSKTALARVPAGVSSVHLHVTDLVTLIDHTTAATLLDFVEDFKRHRPGHRRDRRPGPPAGPLARRASPAHAAPVLAQELAEARTALARISLTSVSPEAPDPVAYLERISLTHFGPIAGQDDHVITAAAARAWQYLARKARAVSSSLRSLFVFSKAEAYVLSDGELARASLSRIKAWCQ